MINQKNVENLYQSIMESDEYLYGSQWEDFVINEDDTPKSILKQFINIFVGNDFRKYDEEQDAFVSIANREERKETLIKIFESAINDLKNEK